MTLPKLLMGIVVCLKTVSFCVPGTEPKPSYAARWIIMFQVRFSINCLRKIMSGNIVINFLIVVSF